MVSLKADITKWWFLSYKIGLDQYTQTASNRLAANGVLKQVWQNGMMSDNTMRFRYMSHDFMSNISKRFGDFDLNLLLGATIDETKTDRVSMMAYNFTVPRFLLLSPMRKIQENVFSRSLQEKACRLVWRVSRFLEQYVVSDCFRT